MEYRGKLRYSKKVKLQIAFSLPSATSKMRQLQKHPENWG